jgi:hypothetical protein
LVLDFLPPPKDRDRSFDLAHSLGDGASELLGMSRPRVEDDEDRRLVASREKRRSGGERENRNPRLPQCFLPQWSLITDH